MTILCSLYSVQYTNVRNTTVGDRHKLLWPILLYIYVNIKPYDLSVDQLISELRDYGSMDNTGRASIAIRALVYSSIG